MKWHRLIYTDNKTKQEKRIVFCIYKSRAAMIGAITRGQKRCKTPKSCWKDARRCRALTRWYRDQQTCVVFLHRTGVSGSTVAHEIEHVLQFLFMDTYRKLGCYKRACPSQEKLCEALAFHAGMLTKYFWQFWYKKVYQKHWRPRKKK